MIEAVLSHGSKRETYSEFVDKFKDKHTTDDCMTPPAVYDVVADWVAETYDLDRASFVRPFWPGGDYERFDYPEGCVVVDNPPFSLSSKIYKYYNDHNIKFFLFASELTLFSSSASSSACACIVTRARLDYENGAHIVTSFVTNLEPETRARTAPDLHERLTRTVELLREKSKRKVPRYAYPPELVTPAMMGVLAEHGIAFGFTKSESERVSALDEQRARRKGVFGSGYLLSDKATAEKVAAEKAASEKAAEKAAAIVWTLSERERAIVARLSEGGDACYKTTDTRN